MRPMHAGDRQVLCRLLVMEKGLSALHNMESTWRERYGIWAVLFLRLAGQRHSTWELGCKARACASDSTAPRITRIPLVRSSGSSSDRLMAVSLLARQQASTQPRCVMRSIHHTCTWGLVDVHSRAHLLLLATEAL